MAFKSTRLECASRLIYRIKKILTGGRQDSLNS